MKKSLWTWSFLTVTATAIIMELWAAFDASSNTQPWTDLIANNIPEGVALTAIGILIVWLPSHFLSRYDRGKNMSDPLNPNVDHPAEPLMSRAAIVAAVTVVLNMVVAFGVPLSDQQEVTILAVVNTVAPLVLAVWARHHVYSPASVAKLVAAAKATPPPGPTTVISPNPPMI